jgi:tetratricopeptide (TPR) repeat protein
MNMKKPLSLARGAANFGLCLSAVLGFASSSFAERSDIDVHKFELQVFQGTIAVNDILSGDMGVAVEKIHDSGKYVELYAKKTNLCVAYTAQGEYNKAVKQCQAAQRLSKRPGFIAYSTKREKQALALNNLGVLLALQGHTQEARKYFSRAGGRSTKFNDTSLRNIDALEERMDSAVTSRS